MSDVFVSYSRRDLKFAGDVRDELERDDLDVWIDVEGIYAGEEFWPVIQRAIDNATVFVFLMSGHSLESSVCAKELAHAVSAGKRIVPVCHEDAITKRPIPEVLGERQWVFFRDGDDAETAVRILLDAIRANWVEQRLRSRVYARASEWLDKSGDPSLLFRGRELAEAQDWLLRSAGDTDPETVPTNLHRRFLDASRTAVRRRRQKLATASTVALVAVIMVGWLALNQTVKSLTNFSEGMELERIEQLARADTLCQRFWNSFAACPIVTYSYGLAHIAQNDLNAASERFSQTIDQLADSADPENLGLLGNAYQARAYSRIISAEIGDDTMRIENYAIAEHDIEKAAEQFASAGLDADVDRLNILRARIHLGTGSYDEALGSLVQTVTRNYFSPELNGLLGLAHMCKHGTDAITDCDSDQFPELESSRWEQNQQFYQSICLRCARLQ